VSSYPGDAIEKNRLLLANLFNLKARLEAVDLSGQPWKHPALGELDLYQWLVIIGEQEDRHRLRIERVKSTAGFPSQES